MALKGAQSTHRMQTRRQQSLQEQEDKQTSNNKSSNTPKPTITSTRQPGSLRRSLLTVGLPVGVAVVAGSVYMGFDPMSLMNSAQVALQGALQQGGEWAAAWGMNLTNLSLGALAVVAGVKIARDRTTMNGLSKELTNAKAAVKGLNTEIVSLRKAIDANKNTINDLINVNTDDLDAREKALKEAQKQLEAEQTKLEKAQQKLAKAQEKLKTDQEALKKKQTTAQRKLAGLETREDELSALEEDLTNKQQELDAFEAQLNQRKTDLDALQAVLNRANHEDAEEVLSESEQGEEREEAEQVVAARTFMPSGGLAANVVRLNPGRPEGHQSDEDSEHRKGYKP